MRRTGSYRAHSARFGTRRLARLTTLAVALALVGATSAAVVSAPGAAASGATPRWTVTPSPSPTGPIGGGLGGVACPSSTNCIAVGATDSGPMSEKWNGTGWTIVATPTPAGVDSSSLFAVSCPSATTCFAVGDAETDTDTGSNDTALIEEWNGTAWSILPSPTSSGLLTEETLTAVSCASTTDCFAVGSIADSEFFLTATLIEHWDGTSWSFVTSPNPTGSLQSELIGVSCSSASSCFAVGDSAGAFAFSTLIEQWDGSNWTISPSPAPIGPLTAPARSASSPSPTAPGISPLATLRARSAAGIARAALARTGPPSGDTADPRAHPDGADFGTVPGLNGVSCTSASSCFAVGVSDNGALLEQWNGTAWAIDPAPPLLNTDGGDLIGVTCLTTADCTAVGAFSSPASGEFAPSHTLAEHWNGTSWSVQRRGNGPVFSELDSVSCTASNFCAAVGDSTSIQQWNGSHWSIATLLSTTSESELVGVACPSATTCFAVGSTGTNSGTATLVEELSGGTWSVLPSPNPPAAFDASLIGIACSSTTNCFAVGSVATEVTQRPLIEHWNGTSWSISANPPVVGAEASELIGISCPAASSCNAVGFQFGQTAAGPLAEHWNGTSWSIEPIPSGGSAVISELIGISCASSTDCAAVGVANSLSEQGFSSTTLIEHWDGTAWSVVTSPATTGQPELIGVSCSSATNCNATGVRLSDTGHETPIAEHWNGVVWSVLAAPAPAGAEESVLAGIACRSSASCYAVGGYATATAAAKTLVEHWNGATWTIVASATPAGALPASTYADFATGLNGVSCPTSTSCIAVGVYNTLDGYFTLTERGV